MTTHDVIDPTALRARTVKLATDVTSDIFALAADDGCLFESPTLGVAGHGVAATFELGAGLADANALARSRNGWPPSSATATTGVRAPGRSPWVRSGSNPTHRRPWWCPGAWSPVTSTGSNG